MDITAADIKKFQCLYSKYFKISLDDSMARVKLMMLVRQMEVTYKPITHERLSILNDVDGNERHEQARPASDS